MCGQCQQQFHVRVPSGGLQQRITRSELVQLLSILAARPGSSSSMPAASQRQIDQLPEHKVTVVPEPQEGIDITEDERITCMVCISEKEVGETVRTLPCMHSFHKQCIDEWLRQNRTCPICKTDIMQGIADAMEDRDADRDPASPSSS